MSSMDETLRCPACDVDLERETLDGGSRLVCPGCLGSAVTIALLRRIAPKDRVNEIWNGAAREGAPSRRQCPSCRRPLRVGRVDVEGTVVEIDGCQRCQLLWFDGGELLQFSPERQGPDPEEEDPSAASHAEWRKRQREWARVRLERSLRQMTHGRHRLWY